jgi:hypothetical protein
MKAVPGTERQHQSRKAAGSVGDPRSQAAGVGVDFFEFRL